MNIARLFTFGLAFSFATAASFAQTTNYYCTNAVQLISGANYIFDSSGAPANGSPSPLCGYSSGRGLWFTITATNNQRVSITTCGTSFDTLMGIYTNTCDNLIPILCNDNDPSCGGTAAGVNFNGVSNTSYYVLVGGYLGVGGSIHIVANLSSPPANDLCAGAIDLTTVKTTVEDITYATELGDATDSCGVNVSHGVWFTVTPAINERVIIKTAGSTFATALAIYTNTCGGLSNILCNSYCCSAGAASVDFVSVSNVTYHILAGGYGGQSGTLVITATLTNPPANDLCANPTVLNNGVTVTQDVTYATEIGDAISGCGPSIGHGVWFTLAAFTGQQVTIGTCGSTYSTDLLVYTNACGSPGNPVTCSSGSNPFNCAGNLAGVSFIAPTNTTYYILASGVGTAAGTLNIVANLPPPTNDTCNGAIVMTNGVTYSTNTTYATSIGDPVPGCSPSFGRGVWYSYTPSVSGLVGVTTCGSSFQTALAVYTGTCGSLNEVACSQISEAYCTSGRADINFNGTAGTTYHILAGGINGQAGNLQILIPVVDLVSTGLTATNPAGGLLTAGRNFSAGWLVQNQGTNSINGTWTDSLMLSNGVTNMVIHQFSTPHLATAGGSYSNGGTWNLGAIPAGTYTLIAQADASGSVAENNESNNIQTLSVTVTNIPPTITLLSPTNQIVRESCVAVPFKLYAQAQSGSYTITNVTFYDNDTIMIGQDTDAPYVTTSLALNLGTHTIKATALDNFGLSGTSTNLAMITIQYPTNLNILRVDLDTNGNFVGCMCAYQGSNYVIQTTSNLQPLAAWLPYSTNLAITNIVAFTNHPTDKERFFRALRLP